MIASRLGSTGFISLLFAYFSVVNAVFAQPCPTLGQNATLTSSDCAPGLTPCILCPGDQFTLTPTGVNLVPGPGNCINWYYGTTNNFNPYLGEGTLLGCSPISTTPPNSCNPCPTFLGIFVDACGTEENNEFLGLYSGGGFFVDDLMVDFDAQNNTGGGENDDIGGGCGWQSPDAALLATLQSDCPSSTIVGVGPGESVPPNVPVIVFTSSAADFNYNVSALCAVSGNIYVLQSSCARTFGAFSNGSSVGTRTTTVSLACGCSSTIAYDCGNLALSNGAFVANTPFGVIYGTAGCSFPTFPGLPGGSNPVTVEPLDVTVTQAMCNGGPYFVVGILEPLPAGCTPVFTNYLGFNVPCPNPTLGVADVCDNVGNFDLNTLEDPAVPNGTWSGTGVSGNSFNAIGLSGAITLTFTPSGPCASASTTTITVTPTPGAVIAPLPPACPGSLLTLNISFSGQGPFDFELLANGNSLGNFITNDNPALIDVPFNGATTYAIQNLNNGICNGANTSIFVAATGAPNAVLSLSGPSSICGGQNAQCSVSITGGSPPFTLVYAIDGVNQPAVNTGANPALLNIPLNNTATISLVSVQAGSCLGTASGSATVNVAPAPMAEIQTGTTAICNGQTETIQIDFTGAGPFTFEYAVNGVAQGPITTAGPLYEIMAMPPASGAYIYTLISVSANGCVGTVTGADTLIVAPPPSAVLSGSQTICPGGTAELSFVYTGPGPFQTFYSINGVQQPFFSAVNDTFLLSVNPGVNATYQIDSVATNGCPGTVFGQAQVDIGSGPTAVLGGGGPTCTGGSGVDLTITFTGAPPFTFEYTANSVLQAPIVTNLTSYTFNVNPPGGVVYLPVSVADANCTGIVSGQAVVFVFTQPTANMLGDQTFCDSANTNITIDFTGTGPFTVEYTRNGIPQTPLNTTDDPFLIPVNTDSTTNFVLTQVTSPGCLGLISGSATITINYAPVATNLQQICNPVNGTYRVLFDIVGGTPPYTLVGGVGAFAGNTFTSNDIPQALPYNIEFHDAANCGNVVLSGISTCNCTTDAGTLTPDTLEICRSQTATANYNNNVIFDGNDVLRFILQTNPGAPLGTILAWNSTPSFNFIPGMSTGVTYYISAIAGNPAGGVVDLNDPCLSVSPGIPVRFFEPPFAAITANDSICPGAQAILPVSLNGSGPYSLNWTLNGSPQGIGGIPAGASNYQLSFNVLSSTRIILTGISDQHCSVVLSDTAFVYVGAIPQILNPTVDCDLVNGTYTLGFSANGAPPFAVNGISGSFVGNVFTSVPIPGNLPYQAILNDADACAADTVSGAPNCVCATNAGTISTIPLFLCAGDTAQISGASGTVLDNNDVLTYFLVDGLFNPIAGNDTPAFAFDPLSMSYGTTYFIIAYAGDSLPGGGVDMGDPCLSMASGPGVLWNNPVGGNLSGDATICAGDSALLNLSFTGDGPWNATYTANGVPVTLTNIVQTPLPIYVEPTVNTIYILTAVDGLGGNCPGTPSGQANVDISVLPQILNPQITCDFVNNTFIYQFDLGNGAAPNSNYAISGIPGVLTDTSFISNALPAGPFSFTIIDDFGCSIAFSAEGNCNCQTDAGSFVTGNLSACLPMGQVSAQHNNDQSLDADDVLGFVLCSDPSNLPASILSNNTTPDFGFQPGMTAGTPYFIVAVAGNNLGGQPDWSDPCLSQSMPIQVIFYNPPTAVLDGDTSVCRGSTVAFKIRFTGDSPFTFQYALNGVPQPVITAPQTSFNIATNNIQQTQVFTLISIQDEHCPGTVSGIYTIDLLNSPMASLVGDATICLGDTTALQLQLTDADSADITINAGGQLFTLQGLQQGDFFEVGPITSTAYTITAISVYGNNCTPVIGPGANVTISDLQVSAILSDYNGLQISCFGENDGSIALSATGGISPLSANWSSGQSGLVLQQLTAGTYSVTVTDQIGCQFTDTYVLREAEPLQFSLLANDPRCADPNSGALFIDQQSGGNGPIEVYVNGSLTASPATFPLTLSGLPANDYLVELVDDNGCTAEEMASIQPAIPLSLDLGPDIEISLGESIQLIPILNTDTLASFVWSPENFLDDPFSLTPFTNTINTLTYSLSVVDTGGCTASDDIMVVIRREKRVYVPNAISPEGTQADNTVLTIYGGPEVLKVKYLRIYDRWGEMLFENTNFQPNQPDFGWDGRQDGRIVLPGVYIYASEVEYADGSSEEFNGDVTVVR